MGAADVDDQYVHGPLVVVAPRRRLVALSAGHSFDAFDRGSRSGRGAVGFSIQDFAPAGARRARRRSCRRCADSAVTSSPAQSRARRAPRPPYSVQGRAFFRTPYRGRRARSASPENHWTNGIFCRQRQKINVLWSGARSPNVRTLNARTAASRRFIDKYRHGGDRPGVQKDRRAGAANERPSVVRPAYAARARADRTRGAASPELAFLAAQGFSPERLLNAIGAEPTVRPVDALLNEGLLTRTSITAHWPAIWAATITAATRRSPPRSTR